ncbi:MAG: hypothetical protein PHF00_11945, partial [Elusimicrobia bacterium]|nr:hypothetical protein [Elusimicrobiota bacterium]
QKLPPGTCARLAGAYDLSRADEYLPGQRDSASYSLRKDVKRARVARLAEALAGRGFEFVICSLKSAPGPEREEFRHAHPCDGSFYA